MVFILLLLTLWTEGSLISIGWPVQSKTFDSIPIPLFGAFILIQQTHVIRIIVAITIFTCNIFPHTEIILSSESN